MNPYQTALEGFENDGVLKKIRVALGNNKSVNDFLELEIEVMTLVLMLKVDVQHDSSSSVSEYRRSCQQLNLPDDGYHGWASGSFDRFMSKWSKLDRTLYPEVIREFFNRHRFEDECAVMAPRLLTHKDIQTPLFECQLGDRGALAQSLTQQHAPFHMKLPTKEEPATNQNGISQGRPLKTIIQNESNESTTPSLTRSFECISFIQNDASNSSPTTDWPDTEPSHLTNGFRPSRASKKLERTWTEESIGRVVQAGGNFNPNFKSVSDFWLRNQSCPEHLNCAIRIENIASNATEEEIFDMIREGKVFSFSMTPPKPGRLANCAARLVFNTLHERPPKLLSAEPNSFRASPYTATVGVYGGTVTDAVQLSPKSSTNRVYFGL